MERLRELLDLFNNDETRGEMSAEELDELLTLLREQAEDLLDDPSDEDLAALDEIAESVEAVEAEQTERETAAAERAERAQSVADRIRGNASDDGDGDDGETETAEDGGETEEAETSEETAETDGDEGDETAETEVEETTDEEEREPIAAAGSRNAPYRPRVTRVAARRPQTEMERQRQSLANQRRQLSLVASANVQASGIVAGEEVSDPARLAAVVAAAWDQTEGYRGPATKVPVARAGALRAQDLYGEDRFLSRDSTINRQRIDAVTSRQAIVAAGGRCVDSPVSYDLPTVVGSDARPVRDRMLTRFGADRGGVKTRVPFTLHDVSVGDPNAVGVWTETNDQNPSDPATKPVQTFACHDDRETIVQAITKRLQFGEFRARFDPESIQEAVDLVGVWHARTAENELLTKMGNASFSTAVTSGQLLGATRDVLAVLDRAQAGMRSFHRMDRAIPLVFGFPFWLYDMIRTDIARALPTGSIDENLALAEAQIDRWLTSRNVRPVGHLDGGSSMQFGEQGAGPLAGWPSTVETFLYPEGSWLFLDGGSLDLGIVRDTTTMGTNDFQMFAETFEAAHFDGVESYKLTMDLCPDGAVSGTVDIDPCSSGS